MRQSCEKIILTILLFEVEEMFFYKFIESRTKFKSES